MNNVFQHFSVQWNDADPEDRSSFFILNITTHLQDYITAQRRGPQFLHINNKVKFPLCEWWRRMVEWRHNLALYGPVASPQDEEPLIPTVHRSGWAPQPGWTIWKTENTFPRRSAQSLIPLSTTLLLLHLTLNVPKNSTWNIPVF